MSGKEQDIEMIDEFLDGKLSDTQLEAFNVRVAEDENFRQLVQEMKIIQRAVISKSREDLLEKIKAVDQEEKADSNSTESGKLIKMNARVWYRVAAIISFVAIAGYAMFQILDTNDLNLYDKYYSHYSDLSIPASRSGDPEQTAIQFALESYMENDFNSIHELLQDVDAANVEAALLRGLAYLGQENFEQAILYLEIVANSETQFTASGRYYLALSFIGIGEMNQALNWLESIRSSSMFPVEKLIQELKSSF